MLKPDGIMTVMFTHKATGAWDALTKGLMQAGFVITASWPINTEAEGSLHIKDKSAANSTIFLVCRPRDRHPDEDLRSATGRTSSRWSPAPSARASTEFQEAGHRRRRSLPRELRPCLEEFSASLAAATRHAAAASPRSVAAAARPKCSRKSAIRTP